MAADAPQMAVALADRTAKPRGRPNSRPTPEPSAKVRATQPSTSIRVCSPSPAMSPRAMRRPSKATPARSSGRSAIFMPGVRSIRPASGAAIRKPAINASGATGMWKTCPTHVAAPVSTTAIARPGTQAGIGLRSGLATMRCVTIRSCSARMRRLPVDWNAKGKRPCRKQQIAPRAMEAAKLDAWPRCWK